MDITSACDFSASPSSIWLFKTIINQILILFSFLALFCFQREGWCECQSEIKRIVSSGVQREGWNGDVILRDVTSRHKPQNTDHAHVLSVGPENASGIYLATEFCVLNGNWWAKHIPPLALNLGELSSPSPKSKVLKSRLKGLGLTPDTKITRPRVMPLIFIVSLTQTHPNPVLNQT